jgi:hypothetical protein
MVKYKIKYSYCTGDSFSTQEGESVLEFEWTNLDIAKESLKRIVEHYKWYQSMEYRYLGIQDEKPSWWNVPTTEYNKNFEHYQLNIPMDNGKEIIFQAPWCGYFESLYGVEIITEDKDMKYNLRGY